MKDKFHLGHSLDSFGTSNRVVRGLDIELSGPWWKGEVRKMILFVPLLAIY